MTVDTMIMLSGALVAVLPFLGFPNSWDNVLYFLAGIFVISLGIVVRRRGQRLVVKQKREPRDFVEAAPHYPRDVHEEL